MTRVCLLVLACSLVGVFAAESQVETFWQDRACARIDLGDNVAIDWCVETLVGNASGQLELTTTWTLSGPFRGTLDKTSDAGNDNMYLVDNLGRRYDHVHTQGAAADGGEMSPGRPELRGVFVFPAAREGATEFTFRDDDHHIAIQGITTAEVARSDPSRSALILGRVMQAEAIEIAYSFTGLGGGFEERYSLWTAGEEGFRAEGRRSNGHPITMPFDVIPGGEVETFLTTLAQSPVLERDYVPKILRDHGYPSITVELRLAHDVIRFFSRSQGVDYVPWGVEAGGKVFVIPDATPARALQRLDPFLGRDLASRATKFLAPQLGEERAEEIWTELEKRLGAEDAYKTAFRLRDRLQEEEEHDAVLATLEEFLERREPTAEAATVATVESALLPDGDRELVRAARDGDVEKLKALLSRGVDPNERSELDGHTALLAAAADNRAGVVRLLLSKGADVAARSRTGETALTIAAAKNAVDTAHALLEAKPDVDVKGRDGKTPLMQAAENGHAEIVAALLQAGASVDTRSLGGGTALGFAAANSHLAVVRLLLGSDASPDPVDGYGETPLMNTTHPGIARALIRAGADVNRADAEGLTPAMRLSADDGPSPLAERSRRGRGEDRLGTLRALLTAGADPNARDRRGRTALIWATTGATGMESRPELLPVLIEAGADVDAADADGGTALLYAAIHGHLESARILIEAGANVNARMDRVTPLGYALSHAHTELVQLLLRSGGRR